MLVRVLWAPSQVAEGSLILHYDRTGLRRCLQVPSLTDPHDLLWDGSHYIAVSSMKNAISWYDRNGEMTRCFQPVTGDDCWHVNCVALENGVLYATAFGRFNESRGWVGHRHSGAGMLFRVDTGEDVIGGLCCPHSPRREGQGWLLCSSSTSELLVVDDTAPGHPRRIALQDWTRGIAITDNHILVGESVNRLQTQDVRGAHVAILDRRTYQVLGRLLLPYRAVYDLVMVSDELLSGLQRAPAPELDLRPCQLNAV